LLKLASKVIAATLFFGVAAIPAYSAGNTLKVSNPPAEFIIGAPDSKNPELKFSVIVTGPVRAKVGFKFVDYVYSEDGSKDRVPANSTPYSLAKVFNVKPFDNLYRPSAGGKEFIITLVPKTNKIDQLYYGGVSVSMEAVGNSTAGSKGSASPTGAVATQVNVTPYGFTGGRDKNKIKRAQVESVGFVSKNRTSVIDYLLPDLPGLINSGPIEAKVKYRNVGALPVFASASWKFSSGEEVLASKRSNKAILLAGKSASRSVITQSNVVDSKSFVNVLPDFGPVDIETTVQSELGGTLFKPEIKKSTLFIVQWKEPFFFTALAASFIWYVSRRRPSKEGQKRKEPSLLWLAIKALTKYLKKRFSKSSKSAK
jgi:hypothetical protein